MGPKSRYMGPWIPAQKFIWQDPVPAANYKQVSAKDIAQLKKDIVNSGLTTTELVKLHGIQLRLIVKTDYRGGSNGARIVLAP